MAKIHIPGLIERPTRTGPNYYWQPSATLRKAGWPPKPLGKDRREAHAAAEERNAAVDAWRKGGSVAEIPARPAPDTLASLIARYRADWMGGTKLNGSPRMKASTRRNYKAPLDRLETWAGTRPLDWITVSRIEEFIKAQLPKIGHAAARHMLKTLRGLFTFASRVGLPLRHGNPAELVQLGKSAPRKGVWELEDEAAFKAAAIDLGLPGMALAMDLAIYTGQRAGDLIAMNEAQLAPLTLHDPLLRAHFAGPDRSVLGWCFDQQKLSDEDGVVHMQIPIEAPLRARIETALRTNRARDRAGPRPRLISRVLVDDHTGRPWSMRQFHRHWTQIAAHAVKETGRTGLLDLVWHDLRRTRVVRLRRQGMAPPMIATITGHSTKAIEEMLRVYGPIDPTMTAAAIRAAA